MRSSDKTASGFLKARRVSAMRWVWFGALATSLPAAPPPKPEASATSAPVSYWKQIRPLFQANCQGCHQPAKDKGGYVMTDFKRLLSGGDSGRKAVVPGKPDASHLVGLITPKDGEAEMPPNKPPLQPAELTIIRQWIAQGAKDDTPKNAVQTVDDKHPPVYQRPPVITSLDYSPDGALLAVAGFHEVLLHKADGSGLVARLVGLSERIESAKFSPDGTLLAVAGGLPARMGEIQIWDVQRRKLTVSVPVGYDTVYGVSWSPDSKLVAFGCPDFTVRAIEAATGKQVLQQGSHTDWVLDTVFNTNGTHIISVGRDMSTKLTEVETQRFVDNVSSITPGALRGGLHSIARRPGRDEVVVGGANGAAELYQVFRKAARKIGDNANLLRKFPPMDGRIFAVDYSPDGKLIAAGASLDGRGTVAIYNGNFETTIPTNILKAYEKVATAYTAEEKAAIEKFTTADVKVLAETKLNAGVYALAFSPDGTTLAAAGDDGRVRLINTSDGKVTKEFIPVPIKARPPSKLAAAKQ
jgi:mono/diheme cytochrome c family protein/roadblock/LC7 domain-containing protein